MSSDGSIISFGSPAAWTAALKLVLGALRRHWLRMVVLVVLFGGVATGAASLMTKTWSSETRLMIRRNYLMPALAHPKRTVPTGAEAPAAAAPQFVMRRESLQTIVRTTRLAERWTADRSALGRFKDRVKNLLGLKAVGPEELEDILVDEVEKKLRVHVAEEMLVVRATWSDPETAVALAKAGLDAFLDARRRQDIDEVAETIEIVEQSRKLEEGRVVEQLALLAAARRGQVKPVLRNKADEPDGLDGLRAKIFEAARARREVEHQRSLKTADLETRLAQQLAVLTEAHPDVLATRDAIGRMRADVGEVERLKAVERGLLEDYATRGGDNERLAADGGARIRAGGGGALDGADQAAARNHEDEETTAYARSLLRISVDNLEDLTLRLQNLKIELEAQKAAFPYRYQLSRPALRPKRPDAPNQPMIVIGGVAAGIAAGFLSAIFAELRRLSLLSLGALARHVQMPKAA